MYDQDWYAAAEGGLWSTNARCIAICLILGIWPCVDILVLWPIGIQICVAYFYYSLFHNYLREALIKLLGITFNKYTAEHRDFPPQYYCY